MQNQGIRDARSLGTPKMLVLGLQHMFAMFGATVLVPDADGAVRFARRCCSPVWARCCSTSSRRGKCRRSSGQSFAFMAGYAAIAPNGEAASSALCLRGRAACAGLLYSGVCRRCSRRSAPQRVMRFFPPVVTGPIVICIGHDSGQARPSTTATDELAYRACGYHHGGRLQHLGQGHDRASFPILLGVRRLLCLCRGHRGHVDFYGVAEAPRGSACRCSGTTPCSPCSANLRRRALLITAVITIMPIGVRDDDRAHRRHVAPSPPPCGRQLHRRSGPAPHAAGRRSGDHHGVAVRRAGQHHLRREHRRAGADPRVSIRASCVMAAVFAIIAVLLPEVRGARLLPCRPASSAACRLMLYGMISAVGVRNLVENQVDFMPRAATCIVVSADYLAGAAASPSPPRAQSPSTWAAFTLDFSGLAVAAIVGHRGQRHPAGQGLRLPE